MSSKSGSADVLEALGIRIDLAPNQVKECIDTLVDHFGAELESVVVREEHVSFPLPKELRLLTVD